MKIDEEQMHIVAQVQKTLNLAVSVASVIQELGKMQEQTVEVIDDEIFVTLGIERPKSTAYPEDEDHDEIILENLVDIENVSDKLGYDVWDYTYKRPYPNACFRGQTINPGEVTWEGFVQLVEECRNIANIDWVKVFTANPGEAEHVEETDNDEVGDRYAPRRAASVIFGDGKPHSVTFERCAKVGHCYIELTHVQWTIEDSDGFFFEPGELIKPVSAPQGPYNWSILVEGVDGVWYAIAHYSPDDRWGSMLGVAFQNCHARNKLCLSSQTLQFDNLPPLKYLYNALVDNNVEAYLPLPHLRAYSEALIAQHVTGTGVINPVEDMARVVRDRAYVLSYEGIHLKIPLTFIRTINMQFPISVRSTWHVFNSDRN
ncbi:hypothetical protein SPFM12_00082 [Salmonella phage SPFM12]|nr:hypothetical protein SPFM12_00082 [Salmonella phage SPFM12]